MSAFNTIIQFLSDDDGNVRVHSVRAFKGSRDVFHSFVTSAVGGGEWLTSRFGRLTPGKEAMCPLNRRLGGPPRNRSGRFWRREKFFSPTGIRVRVRTGRSSITVLTTLSPTTTIEGRVVSVEFS